MKRSLTWLISTVLFVSAACSRQAEPPPPPEEIVSRAVDTMTDVKAFNFSIDRSGGPAFLDPGETISFRRAEGVYVAPDRARATVRVIVPGLIAEVSMVAIGDQYWETNVLTREWVELPAGQSFNPADLFDVERGLQPILDSSLTDLVYDGLVELEEIPGLQLHQVSGLLDASALYDLSFGLIGPDTTEVQLWIHPESYETYRIVITEPIAAGLEESSVWRVDFWRFGEVEEISPPA